MYSIRGKKVQPSNLASQYLPQLQQKGLLQLRNLRNHRFYGLACSSPEMVLLLLPFPSLGLNWVCLVVAFIFIAG